MPVNYKSEMERYRRYYKNLGPMLEKPQGRAYTTIIFSFLAVSLFGWYAIRPTIQTILFLRREIQDKTELNKQMETKISALIEAQAAYQEVESLLPAVYESLPETPQPVELAMELRNLASISGVILASMQLPTVPLLGQEATPGAATAVSKTDPARPSGKQGEISVGLSLVGPYAAIRSFIDSLMAMRRIVWIDAVSIIPSAGESQTASPSASRQEPMLQLVLKVKGYYLIP